MAANRVGSVRRIDRPDAVILHVARSRRALWAASRLSIVMLLAVATIGLGIYLSDGGIVFRNSNVADAIWRVMWTCGGVLLLWWYVGRHIPPLVLTAARQRVTIEIDTRWHRLDIKTAGGVDAPPPTYSWPAGAIEDVVISPRFGDAGELRIVPAFGRAATLFYGLRRDELEFIAATLRDALRLTARDDAEVETDDADEPLRADHTEPAATSADHPPALDYAPPVPQGLAIDRGRSGVTIYVAPLPPLTYLADRWPLIATMFAVIVVWGLLSDTKRDILLIGVALAFLVAITNAAACLTRTTIQLTRTRLSRLTATPLGTIDEGWAARSVRDVVVTPRPPTVELRLTSGETATLANPATADEAEAIAAALRRALRTCTREREAAAAVT